MLKRPKSKPKHPSPPCSKRRKNFQFKPPMCADLKLLLLHPPLLQLSPLPLPKASRSVVTVIYLNSPPLRLYHYPATFDSHPIFSLYLLLQTVGYLQLLLAWFYEILSFEISSVSLVFLSSQFSLFLPVSFPWCLFFLLFLLGLVLIRFLYWPILVGLYFVQNWWSSCVIYFLVKVSASVCHPASLSDMLISQYKRHTNEFNTSNTT